MPSQPSVALLLELNQDERQLQLAHFESLDTKAGVVLGFAGVPIALGPRSADLAGIVSPSIGLVAAMVALRAFWPRPLPTLKPTALGRYVAADLAFTQLRVVDTLEVMINETALVLAAKSRRLKVAMSGLAVAASSYALDRIFQ